MADVKHVEVFDCTPEQFFAMVTDYEKYPEFLSEVDSCRVVTDEGDRKQVEFQIKMVKTFKYVNEQIEDKPFHLSWKFQKGDLFKSMRGHWHLSPENGKTRAEYYVEATFGLFVPQAMVKTALSANLPAMMKAYHKRVAQLYGGSNG